MHGFHHPKGDTERWYLLWSSGGRSLVELYTAYTTSFVGFCSSIKQDKYTRITADHEKAKAKDSYLKNG